MWWEGVDASRFAAEIIDHAGEGIVVYDRDLHYLLWNHFMEELTGVNAGEILGKRASEIFPQLLDQGVDGLLERAMNGETVSAPDLHYPVTGGRPRGWVSAVYRPHYDEAGQVIAVIGLIRDVTERKNAEQQIEYQAYHDALTGLANRRLFQEHLALAIALAGRRRGTVAVLFLDLDHFKVINDTLGHSTGDALLRLVGKRLKSCVREGDTVARVSGDEFTIVLQDLAKKEDAALVARKVLQCVAEPVALNGHRLSVTTSIGITFFPDDGEDAEALLKNADNAVYVAKSEGRNTYQMSTAEMTRATHERLILESGLRQAMERDEFVLHYQPQIDIRTMTIVGMEALLRWNHPQRGLLLPEHFIHVAEERGYIVQIGEWVLREACAQAAIFCRLGFPDFRVAVNLSARQLRDHTLIDYVAAALRVSGLQPRNLELEITESVAIENAELTFAVLAALRKTGVRIAIDDFGTGHSSLGYLKKFPIDALKIDRHFVEDLPDGFEDAAIVQAVVQLARGLDLRVIAEGVETQQQLDFLQHHACPEVQGYHFSYPVPAIDFEKLLARKGAFVRPPATLSH
jgi:diguanylate cyclase (GGDEF)-like protein/PAS domain S-box-containing protein